MGNANAGWAAAGAIAAVLAALAAMHYLSRHHILNAGDRLTPLAVTSLQGNPALVHAAGQAQIINVFATWCPPCRAEMPAFGRFAQTVSRHRIEVIGIDQEESAQTVNAFAQGFHLDFPLYIDETNVTHDVLGARVIPTTVFIDAAGIIRWKHSGPLGPLQFRELQNAVARST